MLTVYPNVGALEIVGLIRTALEDCTVDLYQNDYTPGASTVVGDLDVADFSGYAQKVVADLLPAYISPDGGAAAQIATQQWDHSGGATANTIYGAFVRNAGGDLISVVRFTAPVAMAALGDSIPLNLLFFISN